MQLFKPNVEKLQQKRDVPGLVRLLEDKDGNVRAAAVRALGEIGDPQAVPALIGQLGKSRSEALKEALNRIGGPAMLALMDEFTRNDSRRSEITPILAGFGAPAVAPLIALLGHANESVRSQAGEALKVIGKPGVEALMGVLQQAGLPERRAAAQVLGKIGDAQALRPLINASQDDDASLRLDSCRALGNLGSAQAVQALIARLQDPDVEVRQTAARFLGRLDDRQATGPLVAMLKDPEAGPEAAEALGNLGDASAVEALLSALEQPELRPAAAEALAELGDGRAAEPLFAALQDADPQVRASAARAMGKLRQECAVEPLIAALQGTEMHEAAIALGEIGDTRAVLPLLKLVGPGPDTMDSRAVLWALEKLGVPIAGWVKSGLQSRFSFEKDPAVKELEVLRSIFSFHPGVRLPTCSVCHKAIPALEGSVGDDLRKAGGHIIDPVLDEILYGGTICQGCGRIFCVECHPIPGGGTNCRFCQQTLSPLHGDVWKSSLAGAGQPG